MICGWRQAAVQLAAERDALREKLALFERELDQLKKRVLGRTTERLRSSRPDKPPAREKNDAAAQEARQATRSAFAALPTETVDHTIDAADKVCCPACGADALEPMPADISEEIELVPARLVRRLHRRETARCRSCEQFVRAPAPTRVWDAARYGPRMIAQTIVEKCDDCMPLHRQESAWARRGVPMARSTLCDLFHRGADLLEPIYAAMLAEVPKAPVVAADETSQKMQHVDKLGFVWTFSTPEVTCYVHSPDRSGQTPERVLGDSEGVLVVDGYTGYNVVCKPQRRVRAGCNAHARRKFFDIDSAEAKVIVDLFGTVFEVERKVRATGIEGTEAHLALRTGESKPAMEAILAKCLELKDRVPPKSPLGAAIRYVENQWDPLTVFLGDVRVPPHNNQSERELRLIALGRKNYLFVGHEEAGHRTAILMSLITTCKRHDVNPTAYLADVLIRVQTHPQADVAELIPNRWKTRLAAAA